MAMCVNKECSRLYLCGNVTCGGCGRGHQLVLEATADEPHHATLSEAVEDPDAAQLGIFGHRFMGPLLLFSMHVHACVWP